jgi:hypothetical protein
MESGDKFFVWYQGTGTSKNGAPLETKRNWGIYRRSGRLKGIKGKAHTPMRQRVKLACEVDEYQLAK